MKRNKLYFFITLCVLIVMSLLAYRIFILTNNKWMRVHFIDVGYGDAILIEFPDSSTMLIDAGSKEHTQNLIDYLSSNKITKIDTAIITHPHANHFEGFYAVTRSMPIKRVFINNDRNVEEGYFELLDILKRKNIPIEILEKGDVLSLLPKKMGVTVLSPVNLEGSPNNNSISSLLHYSDTLFLFTADIGPKQQDLLIKNFKGVKKAQCVQIPHHGGPISNNFAEAFPDATFIISTGQNKWGIPHREDLDKIKRAFFRTDTDGTVTVESNGKVVRIRN